MSTNPWILHVKKYAKDNNISYGCAISEAKKSYVRPEGSKPRKSKPKKQVEEKLKEKLKEKLEEIKEEKKIKPDYTDFIVDNWLDPNIGEIIKEYDPELYEALSELIEMLTGRVDTVVDWTFLPLTKKYNTEVILKYDPEKIGRAHV